MLRTDCPRSPTFSLPVDELRRQWLRWSSCAVVAALPLMAAAHGVSHGDLLIDHPYALPGAPGQSLGKVYLRGIRNAGMQAERLLAASSPLASRVVLCSLSSDGRSSPVEAIELPARTTTLLRHTGGYQLNLLGLSQPLQDGERFELTLFFEHAGQQTVKVWVQTPRKG